MRLIMLLFLLTACNGQPPEKMGVDRNSLHGCPEASACLSSVAPKDGPHYNEPIALEEPAEQAIQKLSKIVASTAGGKLIETGPGYMRGEIDQGFFKGIKDIEFFYSNLNNNIEVRSYSRNKLPDFGSNLTLVEQIKFRYFQNDVPKE